MISARPGQRCLRASEDEPPVAVDEPGRAQVLGERRSAHGLAIDLRELAPPPPRDPRPPPGPAIDLRELDPPPPAVLDQRGEGVDPRPVPPRREREQGPGAPLEEHRGLAVRAREVGARGPAAAP